MRTYTRTSILLAVICATVVFGASAAQAAPTKITGGSEQEYSYRAEAAP